MTPIFADPTPRWVPFATAAAIVALVFGASVWQQIDFRFSVQFAGGLAALLLVLILLQGRLFWRSEIASLVSDGAVFEAITATWVGPGRRLRFAAHETAGWIARPKNGSKELASVSFRARGEPLELSLHNPKLIDVPGISRMQPIFFAQLKRDYPQLKSLAG